jgi:di/tricarboxylate transporter
MLAEVMVTPNSRLNGQNLEQIGFRYLHRCVVLGIQRRSRMIRMRMTEIALRAGDVLLVLGQPEDVRRLRFSPAVLLMEWSAADLPARQHVRRAGLVFLGTIGLAASGLLPIVAAALIGAVAMIATGALSVSQAVQALDRKVTITIATALALGVVLQGTGGADFLAEALLDLMAGAGPAAVLSAFFLLVAVLSNILSTKATAVLFTPIAVGIAHGLNSDPTAFAVAVVFAANCSFASPLGYQTNLLVMSPGGYRFRDFVSVGLPLIAVMWLVFTFVAPWYFDLS